MELEGHGFLEELRKETWESFPIDMSEHFTTFDCYPESPFLLSPYSSLGLATTSDKAFECSLSEVYCQFEDGLSVKETEFSEKHDTVACLIQEDCPSVTKDENQSLICHSLHNSEQQCTVELAQETEIPAFSNGLGKQKRVKKLEGQPSKNLMAERRRRKRLNDSLLMLRSVVPKISKVSNSFPYNR